MTQSIIEVGAFEQGLSGLAHAALALGANTIAVLALDIASIEVVYHRTDAREVRGPGSPISCGLDLRAALENNPGAAAAKSPVACFLTSAVAPAANSFFLFPWPARPRGGTIVFGFEAAEPSLNLVALAAWCLKELGRLHAELRAVNHSFAGRRLVERVKGILQSERGMSEQQAYEYLRRMSRQRRVTLSKLAEDLLGAASWP